MSQAAPWECFIYPQPPPCLWDISWLSCECHHIFWWACLWGGCSPAGVPLWTPWLWSITTNQRERDGASGRNGWTGGGSSAWTPQWLFGQGGPEQTSHAGLHPTPTSSSRDASRPQMPFVTHVHIPHTQPCSQGAAGHQLQENTRWQVARHKSLIHGAGSGAKPREWG